jgi:hypothetical protein
MRARLVLPALTLALATHALATDPPAKPARPAVAGTTRLSGQDAKLGHTFTVGEQNPLNFTLVGASYTTARVALGSFTVVPRADEKLFVLRFTAHNPTKQDASLYGLKTGCGVRLSEG